MQLQMIYFLVYRKLLERKHWPLISGIEIQERNINCILLWSLPTYSPDASGLVCLFKGKFNLR